MLRLKLQKLWKPLKLKRFKALKGRISQKCGKQERQGGTDDETFADSLPESALRVTVFVTFSLYLPLLQVVTFYTQ